MSYAKKFGFVKGLAEGLSLDDSTKEGKILLAVIDLLDDMTDALSDAEDAAHGLQEELNTVIEDIEHTDEMVEDLGECVENITDGLSQLLQIITGEEDDDEEDDDEAYYEVKCPKCGEEIVINEEMLDEGSIHCPKCREHLEFDLECDDPECDGHHHED